MIVGGGNTFTYFLNIRKKLTKISFPFPNNYISSLLWGYNFNIYKTWFLIRNKYIICSRTDFLKIYSRIIIWSNIIDRTYSMMWKRIEKVRDNMNSFLIWTNKDVDRSQIWIDLTVAHVVTSICEWPLFLFFVQRRRLHHCWGCVDHNWYKV